MVMPFKRQRYYVEFTPQSLRDIRKARKLSMRALAERVGCSQEYIGMIERGKRGKPLGDILDKIGEELGVIFFSTPAWLQK